jgi:hypothetical protein
MTDGRADHASPADKQAQAVAKSQTLIDTWNFQMNRAFDLGEVDRAFQHAAKMILPLSKLHLSPQNYYVLYHVVSTNLIGVSVTIADASRLSNRQIAEQYEMVQYNRGALQRLYLMVTLGPELATRRIAPMKDVIEDLSEMLKQAQDPIHALFLRHFLLSVFKQHLPESTHHEMDRSLKFLLQNFAQMNRMWVRISDASQPAERQSLSVLVGTNIQRITSLRGLTLEIYSRVILPFISKHVELCEDELAQEFILQSIVHAFPAEYHMGSLEKLFSVFGRVEQGVKILLIVNQLLERLLSYVGELIDPSQGKSMFVTIAKNIEELFNAEGHLALIDKFDTLERLVRFALRINPEDVRNVKNLMKFTQYHIELAIADEPITQPQVSAKLRQLVECPLKVFTTGTLLYDLDHLPLLMRRMLPEDRRGVAMKICDLFLKSDTVIQSIQELQFVLSLCICLVREGAIKSCFYGIFHLIGGGGDIVATTGIMQELANAMEDIGGVGADKAILPIGFIVMRMMKEADPDEVPKLVQFLGRYGQNAARRNAVTSITLFVEMAKVCETIDNCDRFAAELAANAIGLWIEIPEMLLKQRLYGYLLQFMLVSRTADLGLNADLCNFASTYPDVVTSVRALANCAALFWRNDERLREIQNVQACLSKATKAAASATDLRVILEGLYVVFEWTVFCLAKGIPLDKRWVNALVGLIQDKHEEVKAKQKPLESVVSAAAMTTYRNTVKFVERRHLISLDNVADDHSNEHDDNEDEEEASDDGED